MLLLGLAGNPSAPPEALVRLAAANIDRTELARRRDLPARAAVILADDKDANLRSELAANPNLPAEVQIVLARDVDAQVRGRLAEGAEYFTTVGVHARRFPGPLSDDVYERLARDPEPKVRRALAFNRHLPDDIRARMLDDDDARTAAIAAAEWNPAPTARISELLSRATGAFGRELLLLRLDGPLPAEAARGMLADIDSRDDFRGIGSLVGVGEPLRHQAGEKGHLRCAEPTGGGVADLVLGCSEQKRGQPLATQGLTSVQVAAQINDLGYAGRDAFDHVTDYLAVYRPDLARRIEDLYAGLKPAAGTQAGPWVTGQLTKGLPARRAEADRADATIALLRDHGRPRMANRDTEWALLGPAERRRHHSELHFDFQLTDEQMARIATLDTGSSLFFDHHDPRHGHLARRSPPGDLNASPSAPRPPQVPPKRMPGAPARLPRFTGSRPP